MSNVYVIEIINRMIDNTRRGRVYAFLLTMNDKDY